MEIKIVNFIAIIPEILAGKLNQISGRIISVIERDRGEWWVIYESNEVPQETAPN